MLRIVILLLTLPLISSACKNGSSSQAPVKQTDTSQATSAATAGASTPAAAEGPGPSGVQSQPTPRGVYSISEVDHRVENRNAVDMIPYHRDIQFSFRPDGSFTRIAWKQGLIALNETGTFIVENPDHLVLFPTIVNKKQITDGRKSSYKFALSADGYELRLWGARGNVAVFLRIQTL